MSGEGMKLKDLVYIPAYEPNQWVEGMIVEGHCGGIEDEIKYTVQVGHQAAFVYTESELLKFKQQHLINEHPGGVLN